MMFFTYGKEILCSVYAVEVLRLNYGGSIGRCCVQRTLKPQHLHNPSTSVGNMEVVNRLENV